LSAAALLVVAAVVIEIVLPGKTLYHAGWYNVLLGALVAIAFATGRRRFARASAGPRIAALTVVAGAGIAGVAGMASGLLAPDNQSFIGAPGERVTVASLGTLSFPFASADPSASMTVSLQRALHPPAAIGARSHDAGNFILHTFPRSVVYVDARDLRGARLTVTQPTGSVFLSPVLLMDHRQTIAGMDLPFDSFNVPAAARVVKAVMFTPGQAAMLLHGGAQLGDPAVLFAVDDENERPLPHAIALSAAGRTVRVGDLLLRGIVASYPAVEVVAAPNLIATIFGTLLVLGGIIALSLTRDDRAHVA
jgi:hypothetical protein